MSNHNPIDHVDWRELVGDILTYAKKQGATAAEVGASTGSGFTVNVRLGEVETVEYQRDKGVGITVYFGKRKGSASSNDTSIEAIQTAIKAACDIAQATHEDSYSGLPDKELMAFNYPDLDLYHPWTLLPEEAIELAKQCESLGMNEDKRITNSEGCSVATHQGFYVYGNSQDFIGSYATSHHSIGCALIAQEGGKMQRDYSYTTARKPQELLTPARVAKQAALRTLRRLGSRRLKTCRVPVILEAEIAGGLLGSFIAAIRGGNLYRKSSFLLDHLGKPVFAPHVHIHENPHMLGGAGSAPFDDEGLATKAHDFIKDGILQHYVLSVYSARKLGMQPTGNAGGVHNLSINTTDYDLAALLKQMGTGLLVTELMGQGVNIVTGDYSRGAAGFWVENGEIQYPVEEVTIAGNLRDMFLNLVAVSNDVDRRGNIQTGSILLESMVVGGE